MIIEYIYVYICVHMYIYYNLIHIYVFNSFTEFRNFVTFAEKHFTSGWDRKVSL